MDSQIITGFIYALIGSVFMGLYVAPKKLARQDSLLFTLTMVFGFFTGSLLLFLLNGSPSEFPSKIGNTYFNISLLMGPVWAIGLYLFVASVGRIGLSRANPWKNFSPLFGILLGFLILKEYTTVKPLYVIGGGILIVLSAQILTKTDAGQKEKESADIAGILMAVLAGFLLAIVTILNKMAIPMGVIEQQLVWSSSSLVSLFILSSILGKNILDVSRKDNLLAFGAGFVYLGAAYFMLSSYKFLEASIAYTIVQANVIWAVAVGVLYFREIDVRKYKWRIFAGILTGILGILFLALAK